MCYTVGNKTRKRVGYKVVKKKGKYFYSCYAQNLLKVGKAPAKPRRPQAVLFDRDCLGRIVAYVSKRDAINESLFWNDVVVVKVWFSGDVRIGNDPVFEAIISGTHIDKIKEIKR